MADGTGRDSYILANHGGFIQKYKDTGDNDGIYGKMLRNHPKVILKDNVANSPIMSPKEYLKNNSPKQNGTFDPRRLSPKKDF